MKLNWNGWLLFLSSALILLVQSHLFAATKNDPSLNEDIQLLKLDEKQIPSDIPTEKYYAVQSRYVPLKNRFELNMGGGKNFTPSSFLVSQEFDADVRYYFTDRFYTAVAGSYVFNSLSQAGNTLWQNRIAYPDIAPVRYRSDLTLGYNLFYGKFRLSMDSVFYFDQYWAIGGGVVGTNNGITDDTSPALVADAGFSFWFGRHWSLRVGLKDYYFKEIRRISDSSVQHFVGHATIGFVFGGANGV